MKKYVLFFVAVFLAQSAVADISELSQADLRAAVAEDRAIQSRTLISSVEQFTSGEVIDIRAFIIDGVVTYRILYRNAAGEIGTLMVDGSTGRAVNPNSEAGQTVLKYASANPPSNSGGTGNSNSNAGGNGNSNAGGNGNSNAGGNGNSGGNGNGGGNNGGGNGRGNGRN